MRKLIKNAVYAAVVVLVFVLQLSLGANLTLWDTRPDLLPFLAAALGVIAGKTSGAWLGFTCGLLCDLASPFGMGGRMAVYFFAGAMAGELTRKTLKRGFLAAFLFGLAAAVAANLLDILIGAAMGGSYMLLLRDAACSLIYSVLLSPLAYFPLRTFDRLLPTPEDFPDRARPSRITSLHTVRRAKGEDV